jgi:hypothetical protein
MGYNITSHAVNRNKPQLEAMLKAQATIRFETLNPEKLANKIREALFAASELPEFERYAGLKYSYILRARQGEVIAEFQGVAITTIPETENRAEGVVQTKPLSPSSKKTVDEAVTVMDIIMTAMSLEATATELYFPNTILNYGDQSKLSKWTDTQEWKYIDHGESGVTLTKGEVPEEVLWQPMVVKV